MEYLCNVDIGGTNTDAIVVDEKGSTTLGKTPSTPGSFSDGFFNSLENAANKIELSLNELLSSTKLVSHGTTVGTNALLERNGANSALITTQGTEDIIFIMRGSDGVSKGIPDEEVYRYQDIKKPDPFITKDSVYGIQERVDSMGDIVSPFREEQAEEVVEQLNGFDVESVAIGFLWSFLNDQHEKQMKQLLEDGLDDDIYTALSSEVAPKLGEYERYISTTIDAYIGPEVSGYINNIRSELISRGYDAPLMIMEASGGVVPSNIATEQPLKTINSGPSAGIVGCSRLGDILDHDSIITTDMGGTSFDVGLITDGSPIIQPTNVINQYEYITRNIAIETIGSGGGSIAKVDEHTNNMKVGPDSAGADPGPVCYGRGGDQPTVTDADLILGYLDPDYFLGGEMDLDQERATEYLSRIGEEVGMSTTEAASGIVRIVNENMADLINKVSIQKGHDPRKFVMYTYGGAGPVHAADVARGLEIDKVVVPQGRIAGVWSATGIGLSDVIQVNEITRNIESPFDPGQLQDQYEALEQELIADLRSEGFEEDEVEMERFADIRFQSQVNELTIPVPHGKLDESAIDEVVAEFESKYEDLYGEGAGHSEAGYEITVVWSRATAKTQKPSFTTSSLSDSDVRPEKQRDVFWTSTQDQRTTDIYLPRNIEPGATITGPAVIQLPDTTVTVPPKDTCEIDPYGNFIITIDEEG